MTEHDKAFMAARNPRRVLEVAAGTGVVTRALSSALPSSASIVATDLNQSMIDEAARRGTARPVEWKQAARGWQDSGDRRHDDRLNRYDYCPLGAPAITTPIALRSGGSLPSRL
jgi:2-polyprenyl-3-methyl-5-hydroxy-6-metoxy-1,4-benzoquinol methylase